MFALEDRYWWFVGRRAIVRRLLERFLLTRDSSPRMLDLGCGTGANLVLFAEFGRVVGLDLGAEALRLAATRGTGAGLTEGVATRLPFVAGCFEVVACLDVLEHLDDEAGALREMRRVLRPGGTLLLSVPAYPWLWSEHDEALGHCRRYTHATLMRALAHAGLQPVHCSFAICLPLLPVAALRILQQLIRSRRRSARTAHLRLPAVLNRLLIRYLTLEARVVSRGRLPFGVSLIALAQADREAVT